MALGTKIAYILHMKARWARFAYYAAVVVALPLLLAAPAHADYENDPFNPVIARDAWVLISQAERANGIPAGLLHAMSLVETGKGIRGWVLPWPYTIGVNGTGVQKFASREEALTAFARYRSLGFVRFNLRAPGVSLSKAKPLDVAKALGGLPAQSAITLEGINFGRRFNNATEAETFLSRMFGAGYRNIDVGMMQINWKVHGSKFRNVREALDPNNNLNYAVRYLLEHRQTRDWWGSVGRYHSGTKVYANRYIRNVYNMYLRIHRVGTS
ncbi:MAG: hypothetical protein EON60_05875 [Alphaproteobacteria bacterium]|nr:MAG: hypothetical protein EON60_05875 [Alphaproteobacteria bacterium]